MKYGWLMINRNTGIKLMVFLLLWAPCTWLAAQEEQDAAAEAAISEALRLSGIQQHIAAIPQIIQRALQQRKKELYMGPDGIDYEAMISLLDSYYSEALITKRAVAGMQQHYDPNRFSYIQNLLQSPQIKHLVQLKAGMDTPEKIEEIKQWLAQQEISTERQQLIQQLDVVMAESQFAAGIQALSTVAMLNAVLAREWTEQVFPEQALVQQSYQHYESSSREQTQALLSYALRETADDDIRRITAVYNELPLQWFINIAINAISDAMLDPLPAIADRAREQIEPPSST